MQAVEAGRAELEKNGIPVRRPNDFFCENVKSDTHMGKIKDKLMLEEKKMEAFEQRKNREENKKYNKQVAAMRKDEKVKTKKDNIKDVKDFIKGKGGEEGEDREARLNSLVTPGRGRSEGVRDGEKSLKRINMVSIKEHDTVFRFIKPICV